MGSQPYTWDEYLCVAGCTAALESCNLGLPEELTAFIVHMVVEAEREAARLEVMHVRRYDRASRRIRRWHSVQMSIAAVGVEVYRAGLHARSRKLGLIDAPRPHPPPTREEAASADSEFGLDSSDSCPTSPNSDTTEYASE